MIPKYGKHEGVTITLKGRERYLRLANTEEKRENRGEQQDTLTHHVAKQLNYAKCKMLDRDRRTLISHNTGEQ